MRKTLRLLVALLAAVLIAVWIVGTAASAPAAGPKPAASASAIPPGHYSSDDFVKVHLGQSPDMATALARIAAVKPQLKSSAGISTAFLKGNCVEGELAKICPRWDVLSPPDGPLSWHLKDIHQWNNGGSGQVSFQIRTHNAHIMWNQLAADGVTRCMFDSTYPIGDQCGSENRSHDDSQGWFSGYFETTVQVCVKDTSSGSKSTYVSTPYVDTVVAGCPNFPNGG